MGRRRALAALGATAVALALTGCSLLDPPEPRAVERPGTVTAAESGLQQGAYELATPDGAVITFDLPTVPAPDDEVEQLRQDLRVEPVTYVELHIDNSRGTRPVEIESLKVVSHMGGFFPFEPAVDVLEDWDPHRATAAGYWRADGSVPDPAQGAALDARLHGLVADYTGVVPAGATGRELLIGDFESLPESFDDVELKPYPHERALGPAPVGTTVEQRRQRAGDDVPPPVVEEEAPLAEPAPAPPARPAQEAPAQDAPPAQEVPAPEAPAPVVPEPPAGKPAGQAPAQPPPGGPPAGGTDGNIPGTDGPGNDAGPGGDDSGSTPGNEPTAGDGNNASPSPGAGSDGTGGNDPLGSAGNTGETPTTDPSATATASQASAESSRRAWPPPEPTAVPEPVPSVTSAAQDEAADQPEGTAAPTAAATLVAAVAAAAAGDPVQAPAASLPILLGQG